MARVRAFTNGRVCTRGKEKLRDFYVDLDTGCVVPEPDEDPLSFVDMQNHILAPAYQELQINGCLGVHTTTFVDSRTYLSHLENVSRLLVSQGVGAFYVTLPTINVDLYRKILPLLKPRTFHGGADLLGAHCEGPWLNPLKKGAHDANLMQNPAESSLESIYGDDEALHAIKIVTLAPELGNSLEVIRNLTRRGIIVSLGHTAADYDTGMRALRAGAKMLTHVYNAMNSFSHRSPGVAGLVSSLEAPYFSLIVEDLHPAALSMTFRANREKCILISDGAKLAGLPDGGYLGHTQNSHRPPHSQDAWSNKVATKENENATGSSMSVAESVQNLRKCSGCSLAEAVRCASENIAGLMNDEERGLIEEGRRADFVVLSDEGKVQQTWLKGEMVYEAPELSDTYALEDYQLQLMMLEQQNKKKLILAREEHEDRGDQGREC